MDKPILFSAPMVRAILEGRKTMTRRVLKPQPDVMNGSHPLFDGLGSYCIGGKWHKIKWKVGDRLWVREAWRTVIGVDDMAPRDLIPHLMPLSYESDYTMEPNDGCRGRLRVSMHMPRWASRITLEVTGVKVERLQDISEADALAEGAEALPVETGRVDVNGNPEEIGSYGLGFSAIWQSINGPGSWEANPWVVAISFSQLPTPTREGMK